MALYPGAEHRVVDLERRVVDPEHRIGLTMAENGLPLPEAYQALIDHAPCLICMKDASSQLLLVNRSFAATFDADQEELIGSHSEALLPPDAAAALAPVDAQVVSQGRTLQVEVTTTIKGETRTFTVVKFPLFDADQTPYAVGTIATDITERMRYEHRLRHLADHDAMTDLPNRGRFHQDLDAHAREAARYGLIGTVLLVDIDHFKHINDTLGHQAGDQYLVSLTGALRARLRDSDVLARLGGDEFAVLLPHTDLDGAREVANDLLAMCRHHTPRIAGRQVGSTVSIGGCSFGSEPLSAEELLVRADVALYQAKDAGRDRAVIPDKFEAALPHSLGDRVRVALHQDGFELYAQPVVDLASGAPAYYELLLRLRTEGRLLVPPAFLPAAERFDLVQAVDRWVAEKAIKLLADRPADARVPVSINVSGKSIGDPRLLDLLAVELRNSGIDPGLLTFEITETAALSTFADAVEFISSLHELGCQSALDDFGAGFASFYYVKHLPVDWVKIDGEFIRDLPRSRIDQLVVECVSHVAGELGCATVAEFVQDADTINMLAGFEVGFGQGYHFGKPEPVGPLLGAAPAPGV